MRTAAVCRVEACLVELLDTLGLDSVHIAAGRLGVTDWHGVATTHPDRVASLTLVNPPIIDAGGLGGLGSRMLAVAGGLYSRFHAAGLTELTCLRSWSQLLRRKFRGLRFPSSRSWRC
jgi:pimeloyl-ACP methyl ester carboxylesterase